MLLSILPDGISDRELLESAVPIRNVLNSKANLLRTSLAYVDDTRRLKVLLPIREYLQLVYPPPSLVVRPLNKYFRTLLEFRGKWTGFLEGAGTLQTLSSNISNMQNVLGFELGEDLPNLVDSIKAIISLNQFCMSMCFGWNRLMDRIPSLLTQINDHQVDILFLTAMFKLWGQTGGPKPHAVLEQALKHFDHFDNSAIKCKRHIELV